MTIVVGSHSGPWTEEDLIALPDEARGYELLEGTLLVNPPPAGAHQLVSVELVRVLYAAATPGLVVVETMGVRLPDHTMFIPDVLVAPRDVVRANRSGILDPVDVALAVEIVSPSSRTTDRLTKPALYARAGIPSFWRVELEDGPVVFAYRLEHGTYVEVAAVRPGERLDVSDPFPVTFDPAELRP
jgi:Uma2 family endonuclease